MVDRRLMLSSLLASPLAASCAAAAANGPPMSVGQDPGLFRSRRPEIYLPLTHNPL